MYLAIAALTLMQCSVGFADAPPVKVIRHLAFDVAFDADSSTDIKVSGLDGGPASGTASSAGPPVHETGVIVVDVIGATDDGGLIVDVSQDFGQRGASVRVGISDHALLSDQRSAVTNEERTLLHYLARNLVKSDGLITGASWSDDTNDGSVSDHTTYRVTSVDDSAQTVTLAILGARSVRGVSAYETRTTGEMTYKPAIVVPVRLSLSTRTTASSISQLTTVTTRMTSTLREDSFSKH